MKIIYPVGKAVANSRRDKSVGLLNYLADKNRETIRLYGLHYSGFFTGIVNEMTEKERNKKNQRLIAIYVSKVGKNIIGRTLGSWEAVDTLKKTNIKKS
jgi:hypothetical protein